MGKKKLTFIGLSTLLLALLLGLFTTSFAFTEDDCKSLIYNMYVYGWERNAEQTKNEIDNINWTNWNNYFDNDNYQLFLTANFDTIKLAVRYKTGKPYNVNNGYGNVIWGTSFVGFWVNYKNVNNITTNPTNNTTSNFEWYGTARGYYTEFDVYTSSNSNDKVISAGDYSRDFLFYENEYNKQEFFGFQEVETNTHVKLASDGVSMPLYYSPGSSVYFADFIDDDGSGQTIFGKNLIGDELYMYYYTVNSWNGSANLFRRNFNSISDFTSNRYINITRPISGYTQSNISLKSPYILTNVVYNYIINYEEDGVDKFVNYYFYIGDSNTATIDGVIDVPTSIPDLDIYHNRISNTTGIINNNDNTDDIVNTIKSGDNSIVDTILGTDGVDETLHEWASGDAQETAAKLGFQNLSNPYSIVIFGFLNDVVETLQGSGDVYFDYSLHGETPTRIHSRDIYLPNGTLKSFIRMVMIFITIFFIYNRFRILVDQLTTADVKGTIENTEIDVNYFYM